MCIYCKFQIPMQYTNRSNICSVIWWARMSNQAEWTKKKKMRFSPYFRLNEANHKRFMCLYLTDCLSVWISLVTVRQTIVLVAFCFHIGTLVKICVFRSNGARNCCVLIDACRRAALNTLCLRVVCYFCIVFLLLRSLALANGNFFFHLPTLSIRY